MPQIPAPNANLQSLTQVTQALKQSVDSLGGSRGNPSDRAVTFNDLVAMKLVTPQQAQSLGAVQPGTGGSSGGGSSTPPQWSAGDVTTLGSGLTLSGTTLSASGAAATFAGGLTATGTATSGAYAITTTVAQFTTVAANTAAQLPALATGKYTIVINDGANLLAILPNGSGNFTGLAAGVAVSIPPGGSATFWQVSTNVVSVR